MAGRNNLHLQDSLYLPSKYFAPAQIIENIYCVTFNLNLSEIHADCDKDFIQSVRETKKRSFNQLRTARPI